jgi:trehalose synthase-fused probable maltokinase
MASAVKDVSSLASFIQTRRWFRSKTRTITKAEVEDVFDFPIGRILIVKLEYAEGDSDHYVFTDGSENSAQPVEVLDNAAFRERLLQAFGQKAVYRGLNGELAFSPTAAFPAKGGGDAIESFVSRAEQSNTSIVYGDRFILKLFRKIEPGINPDVEVGAFLTEKGFSHIPAVLGTLEYRSRNNGVYAAGILQQFVLNKGDAWKYTLQELAAFFERAAAATLPSQAAGQHPLDRIAAQVPNNLKTLFGGCLESAALLGKRTAEMHLALSGGGSPDFVPEPFSRESARELHDEMLAQAEIAFESLRRKQAALSGEPAELARKLLDLESHIVQRFGALRDQQIDASRIRIHGDFHLGQVLWTGNDFMIIDFEGEPARALDERRAKSLAMRDVAGMLRSFQYAAYAALFDRGSANRDLEPWADLWNAVVSAEFLKSYLHVADSHILVPSAPEQRRVLLDAFVLHKALYEVAYEMNNRPDWVRIPLRGILGLVA